MSIRKQARTGMVWTFAQQFGNQLVGFGVSLVLARILMPAEFGLIGMIAVFISVGQTLVQSGLTQSLIRSPKITNEDYSTVFFYNLGVSLFIYLLVYLAAPFIAEFYEQEILTNLTRLYCLVFIINAFSAVQQARFTRDMNFKFQTMISLPATLIGGGVGVLLAVLGYGVWSLVWSQLAAAGIGSILFWIFSGWSPGFIFKVSLFKQHFGYGIKLTVSGLLDTIFNNAYLIIIGKFFAPAQVGYFTRAETMRQLPVNNLSSALNKVTFPLFAQIQDDNLRLKEVYRQLMKIVVFIIAPTMVLLGVLAEPVFRFLFTSKWLPAVPYFQILCVVGILYPINSYNLNVLKVKGRSDLFLKLEVVKKIMLIAIILITIPFGIYALLWGQVIMAIFGFFINSHYTGKFINYTALQQLKDVSPIILLAVFAGGIVFLLDSFGLKLEMDVIRILIGGAVGSSVYLFTAYLFKFGSFFELSKLIFKK